MKFFISITIVLLAYVLTGCDQQSFGKLDKTPYATRECRKFLSRGAEIDSHSQIDKIVVHKKRRKLTTYRQGKKIHEFRISMGKNANRGDKVQSGDYRTPEGSYTIVRKKCDNRLYRSLMISYPNASDKARARKRGVRAGGYITIHGQPKWNADGRGDKYTLAHDWTEGCIAVSNKAMDQLWKAVQNGVKIDIHP